MIRVLLLACLGLLLAQQRTAFIERDVSRRSSAGESLLGAAADKSVPQCRRLCESDPRCTSFTVSPQGVCTLDGATTVPCATPAERWTAGVIVPSDRVSVVTDTQPLSGIGPSFAGRDARLVEEVWSCSGYLRGFEEYCAHELAQDPQCASGLFFTSPDAPRREEEAFFCACFSSLPDRTSRSDSFVAFWPSI